ncbi:hypothetical protein RFI_17450, partial [Reticulomyxa filosa]
KIKKECFTIYQILQYCNDYHMKYLFISYIIPLAFYSYYLSYCFNEASMSNNKLDKYLWINNLSNSNQSIGLIYLLVYPVVTNFLLSCYELLMIMIWSQPQKYSWLLLFIGQRIVLDIPISSSSSSITQKQRHDNNIDIDNINDSLISPLMPIMKKKKKKKNDLINDKNKHRYAQSTEYTATNVETVYDVKVDDKENMVLAGDYMSASRMKYKQHTPNQQIPLLKSKSQMHKKSDDSTVSSSIEYEEKELPHNHSLQSFCFFFISLKILYIIHMSMLTVDMDTAKKQSYSKNHLANKDYGGEDSTGLTATHISSQSMAQTSDNPNTTSTTDSIPLIQSNNKLNTGKHLLKFTKDILVTSPSFKSRRRSESDLLLPEKHLGGYLGTNLIDRTKITGHPQPLSIDFNSHSSPKSKQSSKTGLFQSVYRKLSGKENEKTKLYAHSISENPIDNNHILQKDDNLVTFEKYNQLVKQYEFQTSQLNCTKVFLENTRSELSAMQKQITSLHKQINILKTEKDWYENKCLQKNEELEEKKILVSVLEDEKEQLIRRNEDLNKRINFQTSTKPSN